MPTLETLQVADSQYEDIWKAALEEYERHTKIALPSTKTANLNTLTMYSNWLKGSRNSSLNFVTKGRWGPW